MIGHEGPTEDALRVLGPSPTRIPMTDAAALVCEIRRRNWTRAHRASDTEAADHCPLDPGPEYD